MKAKVLVTRNIPRIGLKELFEKAEVDYHDSNEVIPRAKLLAKVSEVDALLAVSVKVDDELMSRAPKLKIISNYGVGYDRVDIDAATQRGILVTNTPGVVTEATAELAFGLLISVMRRIGEADKILREDGNFRWGPMNMLGTELLGKTLGIVGFGRIGKSMARRALAFGMKVLYYKRTPRPLEEDIKDNCFYKPLDKLLEISDVVSIHTPLNQDSYHLIGEKELNTMKKGSFLINTARGAVVDEEALVKALETGHISGAGLDVFEKEPKIHPKLLKMKNTVLTPHIGTTTLETRTNMAKLAAGNILNALKGKYTNLVNPEVLKS